MNRTTARALTAKIRHRLYDRYLRSISVQQQETQQDPGQAGLTLWTTRVQFASPHQHHTTYGISEEAKVDDDPGCDDDDSSGHDSSIEAEFAQMIHDLGEGRETFSVPEAGSVEAEWIGHRKDDRLWQEVDEMKDEAKFTGMENDRREELTMLYVHGGAFYLGHPSASRPTIARLVRLTGGRALALRYRLAPQNPFPAALLDLLVAYLSLLYPAPFSLHKPVPASSIVVVGESAGANLCVALVQLILALGRHQKKHVPTLPFRSGQRVPVPLPAGLATACAWLDLTRSLPSWTDPEWLSSDGKSAIDIYGPGHGPYLSPTFPRDSIWPTTPPRGEMYCDVSALCHPLVSPCASVDWRGAPPMWMCIGEEERARDAVMVVAKRAAEQGVKGVKVLAFEAMPHLFFQLMGKSRQAELCMKEWATFCKECVAGAGKESEAWKGRDGNSREQLNAPVASSSLTSSPFSYQIIDVENLKKRKVELGDISVIAYDDALVLMKAMRDRGGTSSIKAKF